MLVSSINTSAFNIFKKSDSLPSIDYSKIQIEEEMKNERQTIGNIITYNGDDYQYNSNLTNILFMVIDKWEPFESSYEPGEAGKSDILLLLSIDKDTKEGTILEINPETITEIDLYDKFGSYESSVEDSISLQYAYGIGGSQSCWATQKTVSELLCNLDIDGYLVLNAGGIIDIFDELGVVDEIDGQDFMPDIMFGLSDKITEAGSLKLIPALAQYLDAYVLTDMSVDVMKNLFEVQFDQKHIMTLPGESVMEEEHERYYVDEEALQELIIDNYYIKI